MQRWNILLTKPSVLSCLGDPQAHLCTFRSPRGFRLRLLTAFHEAIPSELLFPERSASFDGQEPDLTGNPGLSTRYIFNQNLPDYYGKSHVKIAIMIIQIDRTGRIVIPKPIRDELQLTAGTELHMECTEGRIILQAFHTPPN